MFAKPCALPRAPPDIRQQSCKHMNRLKRIPRRTVPAISAFALMLTAASSAALAEPRILSDRFDDWFYRCVAPGDEADKQPVRCEAVQIAQTKQGEETVNLLTLSISETAQDKKKSTVLTVLAPLNVFLPAGVELAVDQGKPATLQFRNCNSAGCWMQHIIDDKMLTALKSGQSGTAKLRLINGQNLNIKFSLKGLGQALKSLQYGKTPSGKT
jgi:invasion protein IalB